MSNGLLTFLGIVIAGILFFIFFSILGWFAYQNSEMNNKMQDMQQEISQITQFIEAHPEISGDVFDEGDEIRLGLSHNKNIYSYYTIVGTEIPQKLWLTYLKLGDKTTIEGQADNLESVYAFFRNIKDYNPNSDIKLQKLGLATVGPKELNDIDSESILTSLNADFYEFRISNEPEVAIVKKDNADNNTQDGSSGQTTTNTRSGQSSDLNLPELPVIKE